MNFLAHLYLAGDSPPLILGNFIGDFVKGKLKAQFPEEIMLGIQLHRNIDLFTDSHPLVRESKVRLRMRYRHYAGVLVDMFYDHILAVNWNKYSSVKLEDFAQNSYRLLSGNMEIFPDKAKYMLPHMIRNNWLLNYREIAGIARALNGLANRTRFQSGLETGTEELSKYYSLYEKEFSSFFPELIDFVEDQKQQSLQRL